MGTSSLQPVPQKYRQRPGLAAGFCSGGRCRRAEPLTCGVCCPVQQTASELSGGPRLVSRALAVGGVEMPLPPHWNWVIRAPFNHSWEIHCLIPQSIFLKLEWNLKLQGLITDNSA